MKRVITAMVVCWATVLMLHAPRLMAQGQSGSIVGWGSNDVGQCNVPEPNEQFVAVSAGFDHSLGLKSDGSIVAWGDNFYGQCNVPAPNAGFVAVAAGAQHSLGVKSDGSIVVWGQRGPGEPPAPNAGFVAVAASGTLDYGKSIREVLGYSLGLKVDGSVVVWGTWHNDPGNPPAPNAGFTMIAAGGFYCLGLRADGSIAAWGDNEESNWSGQCDVPAPNTGFMAVAGGGYHSLGLKADGSIVAWGENRQGQCTVPSPNTGFIAVAAGEYHGLGLKGDGSIVAWGDNSSGQCEVPAPNTGFVTIAAGYFHSLGIRGSPVATFLTSFAAAVQGGGVTLTWQLSEAVDPLHLRLSASIGGRVWDVPITGAGTGSFTAHDASPYLSGRGSVRYVLELRGENGGWSAIREELVALTGPPQMTVLSQPSPNPFNPRTVIRYSLQQAGHATLAVYDLQGRRVRILVDAAMPAGEQSVEWDGRDGRGVSAASGTYVVRLVTDQGMRTSKVTLAK